MNTLRPLQVPLRGLHLVESSAGTGKTWTIATLVIRMLVERRLTIDQILILTFTRPAAAELQTRVRERVIEALNVVQGKSQTDPLLAQLIDGLPDRDQAERDLVRALRHIDEAAVHTIHAFCQRLLAELAFETGTRLDLEVAGAGEQLLSELVSDFWANEVYDAPAEFVRYLSESKCDRRALLQLAREVSGQPDLKVVPTARPLERDPTSQPLVSVFEASFYELKEIWPVVRGQVLGDLCSSPGVSHSRYPPDGVHRWAQQIDQWIKTGPETLREPGADARRLRASMVTKATRKGCEPHTDPVLELLDRTIAARDQAWDHLHLRAVALRHRLVQWVREELPRRKAARGVLAFDDLLERVANALRDAKTDDLAGAIRSRFPAALIDEFQDTDPLQYDIFRLVYGVAPDGALPEAPNTALFLIGDPKQAIYSFRNADIFAYLQAARDAGSRRWTLDTNYRSDPSLIDAVNRLFTQVDQPFLLEDLAFEPVNPRPDALDSLQVGGRPVPPFRITFIDRQGRQNRTCPPKWGQRPIRNGFKWDLPRLVADRVVEILCANTTLCDELGERRPLTPGDIAILVRSNHQARQVRQALDDAGLPFVVRSDESVYKSPEAQQALLVVGAMAEPRDPARVRSALSTSLFSMTATEILHMQTEGDAVWERWLDDFRNWNTIWLERGFLQAFRRVLHDRQIEGRMLRRADGERRLTNFMHISELLQDAALRHNLGPTGLTRYLEQALGGDTRSVEQDQTQIRMEKGIDAVEVATVHKSKGLQYPVVICPYLWDTWRPPSSPGRPIRFHDPADENRSKLDVGSPQREQHEALASQEQLAEHIRLLYVALTRAKHRCEVFWGAFEGAEHAALTTLLHRTEHAPLVDARRRVREASDQQLLEDLDLLVDRCEAVEVHHLTIGEPRRFEPPPAPPVPALTARVCSRRFDHTWRITSFSGLTANAEVAHHTADTPALAPEPLPGEPVILADFPAGAGPGTTLHAIYEHIDFQSTDTVSTLELVRNTLLKHGMDANKWAEPVCTAVVDSLNTPLNDAGLTLADIDRSRRVDEMGFFIPVGDSEVKPAAQPSLPAFASLEHNQGLTGGRLSQVFRKSADPFVAGTYAPLLARLPFAPLRGFLRGFLDLVFEHDDRWYVVDYKSNHLGRTPEHYSPDVIASSMAKHHYILQYHLYCLAVHRMLGRRLPNYNYDRHFGGSLYLFLRGMAPQTGTRGVYSERPSLEVLEGLSDAVTGAR